MNQQNATIKIYRKTEPSILLECCTSICASPVLQNSEAVYLACRKRRLLSMTVNSGVASLIAWLDYSRQKTEVGGKQGHAPHRKILLQQIYLTRKNKMAPSPRQLLNGEGARRISGFTPECRGIKFGTSNVGSLCGRKTEACEELRKRRVDVCCMQKKR